jgi:hypothetical protein
MQVVTQATVTAAERLGLDPPALAGIVGLPEAAICRMQCLDHLLEKGSEPLQRSLLLLRLFRTLNAMANGDCDIAKAWLARHHDELGAIPVERMQTADGLDEVLTLIDNHQKTNAGIA